MSIFKTIEHTCDLKDGPIFVANGWEIDVDDYTMALHCLVAMLWSWCVKSAIILKKCLMWHACILRK